jgi:hypothetical protein
MLESQVTFEAHLEVYQEGLEMKKAEHKLDMTRKQIDEATFLLDCGVISTEEFPEKARKIVNTQTTCHMYSLTMGNYCLHVSCA